MEIKTVDDARLALAMVHTFLQNHDAIVGEWVKSRVTIEVARLGPGKEKFDETSAAYRLKGTGDDAEEFGKRLCEITGIDNMPELRAKAGFVAQTLEIYDALRERFINNSFLLEVYTSTDTEPVLPEGATFSLEDEEKELGELKRQLTRAGELLIEAAKDIAPSDISPIISLDRKIVTAQT